LQAILTAAQEDNKLSQNIDLQSHELAKSMKKDSIAMKTVRETEQLTKRRDHRD
jgi:hypothetical protein